MALLQQLKRILQPRKLMIPIFPVNAVLFPEGVLPLKVLEQRYMDMTKHCLKNNSAFGLCLIRESEIAGSPAVPESIGCTARVTEWNMEQPDMLQLRTLGKERFRILGSNNVQGLIIAHVEIMPPEKDVEIPPKFAGCADLVRKVIGNAGAESFAEPYRFESASWIGHRLAEFLPIKIAAKQKLMELSDPLARLEILAHFLTQQGLMK